MNLNTASDRDNIGVKDADTNKHKEMRLRDIPGVIVDKESGIDADFVGFFREGLSLFSSDGDNTVRVGSIRTSPLRIATFGDSTANVGDIDEPDGLHFEMDVEIISAPHPAVGVQTALGLLINKYATYMFYPVAKLIANGGISGETTTQMLARDTLVITAGAFVVGMPYEIVSGGTTDFTLVGAADSRIGTKFTATGVGAGTGTVKSRYRKSIKDIIDLNPDVIMLRGGSINDISSGSIVTPDNWRSVADNLFIRHVKIVSRLSSSGAVIFDHCIYGMGKNDGTNGTVVCDYPDYVRKVIVYFIDKIKSFYSASKNVIVIDPRGLLCDHTGRFLEGITYDGVHLDAYGSYVLEMYISKLLTSLYGAPKSSSYDGLNLFPDPMLTATAAQSYGDLCTSITIGQSGSAVRQNAKIEPVDINGSPKIMQTIEATVGSTVGGFSIGFSNPIISGNYPANSVFGIELDYLIKSLDSSGRKLTNFYLRFYSTKTGVGTIIALLGPQTISIPLDAEGISGHLTLPPVQLQCATSELSDVQIKVVAEVTGSPGTIKIGVSGPRIIKLQ